MHERIQRHLVVCHAVVLNDEKVFGSFVKEVFGLPHTFSKGEFWRVFRKWKNSGSEWVYNSFDWMLGLGLYVLAMGTKVKFEFFPKKLRDAITALCDGSGVSYCTNGIRVVDIHHSMFVDHVNVPNHELEETMEGNCFYLPSHHPNVEPRLFKGKNTIQK